MNIAFEFDALNFGAGSDITYELTQRGKDGWYPASLPPLQTPFGLKIVLQRAVSPSSRVLSEFASEPEREEEPKEPSRLIL